MNKSQHLLADWQISKYFILKFERENFYEIIYFAAIIERGLADSVHAAQQRYELPLGRAHPSPG